MTSLHEKADALRNLHKVRQAMAIDGLHVEATALLPQVLEHQIRIASEYLEVDNLSGALPKDRLVIELACEAAYLDPRQVHEKFKAALQRAASSNGPLVMAALRTAQTALPNLDAASDKLLTVR